jgi:hypothetical protein
MLRGRLVLHVRHLLALYRLNWCCLDGWLPSLRRLSLLPALTWRAVCVDKTGRRVGILAVLSVLRLHMLCWDWHASCGVHHTRLLGRPQPADLLATEGEHEDDDNKGWQNTEDDTEDAEILRLRNKVTKDYTVNSDVDDFEDISN